MKLNNKSYLAYKLFNSSFTGLSVGILITIYQPLDLSIYSIGGMLLAGGMLVIAKFYDKLLNIKSFFRISLLVEVVMLLTIITFLLLQYSLRKMYPWLTSDATKMKLTRVRRSSSEFTRGHQTSPDFTRVHRTSPEFTEVHWTLPEITGVHRSSPQFTGFQQSSPQFTGVH